MASTRLRSGIKGIIWESTAPIILFAFIQKWHIVIGYTIVRIIMYFFYERIWKKIKWGKCS